MLLSVIFMGALTLGLMGQSIIIRWADNHQYYDHQDNRKIHTGNTSSLGGISWFLAMIIPVLLSLDVQTIGSLAPLLLSMLVLFSVSLWDDFKPLPALSRLGVQLLVGIVVYQSGWYLPVGVLSFPATIFFLMLIINAFNFIDGINGLLGSIALFAFTGFGLLFLAQAQYTWVIISWSAAGAMLAFLRYNFGRRAQIFMGDNGATIIGLLLGVCALQSIKTAGNLPVHHIGFSVIFLALPMLDLGRVVLIRIRQGHSPFFADRRHFHHLFVDNGWSAPQVCRLVLGHHLLLLLAYWSISIFFLQWLVITTGFLLLFRWAQQQGQSITNDPAQRRATEKPAVLRGLTDRLRA